MQNCEYNCPIQTRFIQDNIVQYWKKSLTALIVKEVNQFCHKLLGFLKEQ